ncbi:MAG: 2-C-methyl-D-erythritol 2,4-cyclodiphosphate synthase [Sphaerochaetaceae bacterium]
MRIGTGWDIHPLIPQRPLMIGGVHIPHLLGEEGHSDGDVLIHAVIDALLGAAALGDIGTHFPPSDPKWKNVESLTLLKLTLEKLKGYGIQNIDCTVILEEPRLSPHISAIRISLADACGIAYARVSVKAKTAEKLLGEVGKGQAIIAQAVVLLEEPRNTDAGECPGDWL